MPFPGLTGATVAWTVTLCPKADGLTVELSVVVVAAWLIVRIPSTKLIA